MERERREDRGDFSHTHAHTHTRCFIFFLILTSCLLRSLSLVRMLAKCSLRALWPHRAAIWPGTSSLLATLLRKPALSLASWLGRVSLTFRLAPMAADDFTACL